MKREIESNKVQKFSFSRFMHARYTRASLFILFVVTPLACQEPLGIESGKVTSGQFTASSFNESFIAANAVLNQKGSWVPTKSGQDQWLQIDLYRQLLVSGVVIQGRPDIEGWVTRYKVEYALDGVSWKNVRDENTKTEVCDLSPDLPFL